MARVHPPREGPAVSHWAVYHRHWARLDPPLRPHPEVAAAYRALIGTTAGRVLLQGVTPELADVGVQLVAVDRSPVMMGAIWPGDTDRRRGVVGNWFDLPFREDSFDAAIGDAGLSILEFPGSQTRILEELSRVLRPGAIIAMRVFCRSGRGETVTSLRDDAWAGRVGAFQAFKLRLGMALVAPDALPNVAVRRIHEAFVREFPDRDALSARTGWSLEDIATIDLYAGSADVYCFPTEAQLRSLVPASFGDPRFVAVGGYELAERCPLLVAERRR